MGRELTAVEAVEEARNARGRARALASSLNETCSALEWFVSFSLGSLLPERVLELLK
jgi:hypothetical protein